MLSLSTCYTKRRRSLSIEQHSKTLYIYPLKKYLSYQTIVLFISKHRLHVCHQQLLASGYHISSPHQLRIANDTFWRIVGIFNSPATWSFVTAARGRDGLVRLCSPSPPHLSSPPHPAPCHQAHTSQISIIKNIQIYTAINKKTDNAHCTI